MKDHLTHDQLIQATIGESTTIEVEHLRKCAACSAEVVSLNESLLGFRDSVLNWAHSQTNPIPPLPLTEAPRITQRKALRWSLVAAGVALVMTIPVYRNAIERQRQLREAEDSRLLEQIDQQLSRVVPGPMESLVTLLPNDTSTNDGETR